MHMIKYHHKTIKSNTINSISDERSSCVLIRSNLSPSDSTYKRIELPRCTPITSNDMIFCVIVMNPNSLTKWYVIILRYHVYRFTLYLSWTTIEPITIQKPMEHLCIATVAWTSCYWMSWSIELIMNWSWIRLIMHLMTQYPFSPYEV